MKIQKGMTVNLLAGASNPQMVKYTVTKVGPQFVTVVSGMAGAFPQKVARSLIELALRKNG